MYPFRTATIFIMLAALTVLAGCSGEKSPLEPDFPSRIATLTPLQKAPQPLELQLKMKMQHLSRLTAFSPAVQATFPSQGK